MSVESSHRPSRLPEVLLGVHLLALTYGSLYPWSGWRWVGQSGLAFLREPWPRWWTGLDLTVNVAAYLPVGGLIALLARRRLGPAAAVAIAAAIGSATSLTLEGLQSFLPTRVASQLDWLANSGGALLGALAAVALHGAGLRPQLQWQRRSLRGIAGAVGIALLATWLAIQMPPQRVPFGNGDLIEPLLTAAAAVLAALAPVTDPGLGEAGTQLAMRAAQLRLPVGQIVLAEACGTASAVAAIGLLVREIFPAEAPRGLITAGLLLGAGAARSASAALLLGPEQTFAWLSAGAQGGLVIGGVALAILSSGRRRARLRWAIGAIALTAVLTSVFPDDPYHASMLQRWDRGAWRNFDGLLEAAALAWPFAAILWCTARLRALRTVPTTNDAGT